MASPLRQTQFSSVVVFGLPDEKMPRAYLIVRGSEIKTVAFRYDAAPDWDIRAVMAQWQEWLLELPGFSRWVWRLLRGYYRSDRRITLQ